ncbi:MAG: hypothetical protein LBU03_03015 [Tannerellaceae bacterium]|jgi:hypothetical protein|nr:hypothetical protein [Tannerellaceae bacterium]
MNLDFINVVLDDEKKSSPRMPKKKSSNPQLEHYTTVRDALGVIQEKLQKGWRIKPTRHSMNGL